MLGFFFLSLFPLNFNVVLCSIIHTDLVVTHKGNVFVAIYWHRKSKRLTGGKGCNGFIHGILYITKSNRKTQLGFIYQLDDFHTLPFRLPCISFQCPKTACGYLWCVLSHYSIGFSFIFLYKYIYTRNKILMFSRVIVATWMGGRGGSFNSCIAVLG